MSTDYEAAARARLNTKEGRIEAITLRAYSRRFGAGNSNYIRECADDEYELIGFLAAAEAERDAARDDLKELRMRVEEADALATKKPTDDGEWIAGYHFNTGAWHRLLAEARK